MKHEIHWLNHRIDLENADKKQVFKFIADNSDSWHLHAVDLKLAADCLEENILRNLAISEEDGLMSFTLWGPYYMLRGMSIECLLKAIIVANNNEIVPDAKLVFFVENKISGHNLMWLAERAEFQCSPYETGLLEKLTQHIEWAGRYPTATAAEKTFESIRPNIDHGTKVASLKKPYSKGDFKKIVRLSSTLFDLYYERKALWDQKVQECLGLKFDPE